MEGKAHQPSSDPRAATPVSCTPGHRLPPARGEVFCFFKEGRSWVAPHLLGRACG